MGKSDFAPDGEGGTRQPVADAPRPAAPSGWYDYDGESRWWTGSQWGQFASEIPGPLPGKAWKGEPDPVGGGWYVCAALLPAIAFVAGIVFMAQRRPGGGGVFAVSIAAWFVWVLIFTAGGA